jgi:hypothetical protein
VLEDDSGRFVVVERNLTSNAVRDFDGDRRLLQPILALGAERPGQLGVDIVGVTEIATRADVNRDTIQKWRDRHLDFPRPMATLAAGPVWSWEAIDRWLRIRRSPGRPTVTAQTERSWAAVQATLPPGWLATPVVGRGGNETAIEATSLSGEDRVLGLGKTTAAALSNLASQLRRRV